MKKIYLLLILLLACVFIPNVYAEEIPREGVTYFLEYPDGTEDVIEDYDEAIAAAEEEKLIFTGQTDENGQVVLEDIASEGTLRVVQEVPNGYSTDEREVIINLEENKKVEFKITKGLINPKTGFSILKILLVLAVVITCTILTRKNKKILLALPLLLVVGLVNVKADNDNLVIDVKDNLGRAQSGVTVKVYAKAKIEAAPAIKYDANGGHFQDGTIVMYVRIPYNDCTRTEYYNYYYENDIAKYIYIDINIETAYRDGYYRAGAPTPEVLSNGTIVTLEWQEDPSAELCTLHVGEKTMTTFPDGTKCATPYRENIIMYKNNIILEMPASFADEHGQIKYAVGVDTNENCSNYNSYGLIENFNNIDNIYSNMPNDLYVCWYDKPDGLYVNDILIPGNTDNCFEDSNHSNTFNGIYFRLPSKNFFMEGILLYSLFDDYSGITYPYSNNGGGEFCANCAPKMATANNGIMGVDNQSIISPITDETGELNKFEIVYHGNTVISFNANDFSKSGSNYTITNNQKLATLRNYMNSCFAPQS